MQCLFQIMQHTFDIFCNIYSKRKIINFWIFQMCYRDNKVLSNIYERFTCKWKREMYDDIRLID